MNRARWRLLLRGSVSAGLIALLLSRLHWHELAGLLRGVRLVPLLCASAFSLTGLLLLALRTRLLLRHWGIALEYRAVLALTWLGQFCNCFLPGSTGGDVVKFYRVCRLASGSKTAGFAALLADRLIALVALVLMAAAALTLSGHGLFGQFADGVTLNISTHFRVEIMVAIVVTILLTITAACLWRGDHLAVARAKWELARGEFRLGLRNGPFFGAALLLAMVVHLSSLSGYYLFARALHIPATFGELMIVWPDVMVVTLLPLTVNGYGLRECVVLYYFQRWHLVSGLHPGTGVQETVIALSLLTIINDLFWSLPGAFFLSSEDSSRSANVSEYRKTPTPECVTTC